MAASDPADEPTPVPELLSLARRGMVTSETTRVPEIPSNVPRGLTAPTSTSLHLHATTSDILSTLPPPPPFNLRVVNLTVGAPPPSQYLPLPIPIPIPKFLQKGGRSESDTDTRPKTILQDVSAECHAGEMLAIIGGSGSGKTTLLHSIVGRRSNLPILNGEVVFAPAGSTAAVSLSARAIKDRIGFVRQNDYLLPHLTVRETLTYAAALRLPASVDKKTRNIIVEQTIQELGLEDAADTVVGGMLRKGISGGERRRLSIGCVLVTLPSILCLDEPTTGLDAFTAFSLLQTLSRLAQRNRTVILSIHQPRSDAFLLFSRIVLLAPGGRVVYSALRSLCLNWFNIAGQDPPTEGMNVLDWMVDIAALDTRTPEKEAVSRARVERLVDTWRDRSPTWDLDVKDGDGTPTGENANADARLDTTRERDINTSTAHQHLQLALAPAMSHVVESIHTLEGRDDKRPGWIRQTIILTRRAGDNVMRNLGQTFGLAFQAIGLGIVLGFTFYKLPETPSGIQSLKTLAYQQGPCYFYLTLIYNIFRLCDTELVVFDREREDNLYAVVPYVISDLVANMPVHVLSSGTFTVILYFMSGLRKDDLGANLFIFVADNVLVQLVVVGFALLTASIERTYATASLISNAIQIFLLLTVGYLIVIPPVWLRWIRWISPYFYSFRILILSQFKNRAFECPGVTGVLRNQCDGNALIHGLSIPVGHNVGYYFSGLIGLAIMEHIIACLFLHFYKTGGVKHAQQIEDKDKRKDTLVSGAIDVPWARINVGVQGLGLTWSRRPLYPLVSSARKDILHDVNIRFPAGEVTAILGPSGAGKSSLLQLLAFRAMNPGPLGSFDLEGSILFNGQPAVRNMRGLVAFVEQFDDHHYAALTVRETLRYASILRLPAEVPLKRKIARADEVLHMLGLGECANTLVGGPLLKGISGGEKRRLSLAVQMINDPSVLIVDEPTSGLDSLTASNVMAALKQIASESGRTVIVTLHQPRSDIYLNIDNVVVLVKGGRVAYSGPRTAVGSIFAEAGYPIPPLFNPADHLLDTVSRPEKASNLLNFWSLRKDKMMEALQEKSLEPINADVLASTSRSTPFHVAFGVVLQRMVKNLWRQQQVFWLRLQQAPLLGCIFWMFFERLTKGPQGAQNRIGLIQEFILPIPFVGLLNNLAIFPVDRDVFIHEYQSSARYSSGTFLLAFTIVEIPLELLGSLIWTIVMIIGPGMQTSARIYFEASLITMMLQSFGESLGIAFVSFYSSMGLNVSLVSTAITALTQACGIISVSIPNWLSIIAWGTVMKAGGRIVAINEFVGLRLHCTAAEVASGVCLAQTGEQVLEILGFRDLNTAKFMGVAVMIAVINRLIAWGILKLKLLSL